MKIISRKATIATVAATAFSLLTNFIPASAEVKAGSRVVLGRSVVIGTTCGDCDENESLSQSSNQSISRQNQAIHLFNRGVGELNKQNYSESTKWFLEALKVNPSFGEAHELLGRAYYELKEFGKASLELQTALNDHCQDADTLYYVGDSLAQTGNYAKAAKYLKTYIHSARDTGYLNFAKRELSILEHLCLNSPAGDYFAAATQEGARSWPAEAMPLKVFINENSTAKGYTPEFARSLRASFEEWSQISQNRISFVFIKDAASANIKCDWCDDVTKFGDMQELGLTNLLLCEETGQISAAEISLFSFVNENSRSPEALLRTAKSVQLHEIGHALGLGHSQCDYDVMYALASPEGLEFPLNNRDRNTIGILYNGAESKAMTGSSSSLSQSLLRED